MKKITIIIRWIVFVFLALMAVGGLGCGGLGILSAFFFLISAFVIAPFSFVVALRRKLKLNKKITVILAVSLLFVGFLFFPATENPSDSIDNTASVSSGNVVPDYDTVSKPISSEDISRSSSSDMDSSIVESSSEPTSSLSNSIIISSISSSKTDSLIIDSSSKSVSSTPSFPRDDSSDIVTSSEEESSDPVSSKSSLPMPSSSETVSSAVSSKPENIHKHDYSEATCTAPQTCSECGETKGIAKGHVWEDATYTSPKTCVVCGKTEGSSREVPGKENYHGHVYTGGSSSKRYHYEANCAGKNSHEITWEEVDDRGLTACGTCVLK